MSELQQRVNAVVEDIVSQQNKRSALYQTYEDVLSTFKANKDVDSFRAAFRKVEADHKTISQKISSLQTKLREFWTEGADKVWSMVMLALLYQRQLITCSRKRLIDRFSPIQESLYWSHLFFY